MLGIFNVLTDVDVCCYTQGLYRHCKRAFTGTWLWEKKSTTPGTRTRVSIVPGFLVRRFTSWAIPCPKSRPEDSPHMSSISRVCRSSLNGLVFLAARFCIALFFCHSRFVLVNQKCVTGDCALQVVMCVGDDKLIACFFFVASQLRWLYSLIRIFLSLLAIGSKFSQKS